MGKMAHKLECLYIIGTHLFSRADKLNKISPCNTAPLLLNPLCRSGASERGAMLGRRKPSAFEARPSARPASGVDGSQ